jgi:hypothetical protein
MGRGSAAEARRADQEGVGVGDDCEGDCGDESAVFEMMKVLRDAGACFCFMGFVEFVDKRLGMPGTALVTIV